MLTLLTATGCRPHAWALCERWMAAQTYAGPVHWIVVDDGEQAQPLAFEREGWRLTVVRPEPFWQPGQNTQARNLLAGLEHVEPDDWLVIIEDDDHYKPDWLQTVADRLVTAELVGETRARYYNIAHRRYQQLTNEHHASLCSTAMRGAAIATFRSACVPGVQFIDLTLWRTHTNKMLFAGASVTGIKGSPGRGGIGNGHSANFSGSVDRHGRVLAQWLGADARYF